MHNLHGVFSHILRNCSGTGRLWMCAHRRVCVCMCVTKCTSAQCYSGREIIVFFVLSLLSWSRIKVFTMHPFFRCDHRPMLEYRNEASNRRWIVDGNVESVCWRLWIRKMLRKSKQKSRIDVHLQLKGLKGWIDQDLFKFLNFLTFSSNKSYNQNCWWAIWFGHPWHMFLASLSTRSRIFSIWTHFIASSSHVLYP